jgi:hypothetical protein
MPSKFRMAQLYASKQATIESIIPQEWTPTAKAFYVRALRKAAKTRRHRRGASPTPRSGSPVRSKHLTKRPKHMSQMNLFSLDNASPLAPSPDQPDDTSGDAVVAEMEKWSALSSSTVAPFCVDGLVDEFALVSSLKDSFPLHHTVFRQCASHFPLPHEGNSGDVFSMAKSRSTCNTQPFMLRLLTRTATNKKLYKPKVPDIWKRYQAKYKGMRIYVDGEGSSDSESSDSSDSDSSCDE